MKFTVNQFNERFPSDDARLDYMFEQAYGDMPACLKYGVTNLATIEYEVANVSSAKIVAIKYTH